MKASPKVKTRPDEVAALRARIDELERIVALQAQQHCHAILAMPCQLPHYPCLRPHSQAGLTWPPYTITCGTGEARGVSIGGAIGAAIGAASH